MFMLNIIVSFLGVLFFTLGFLVCFKKKYNLISFVTRDRDNAENNDYAEQIGLISLMSGMLYIFAGIVGFVSSNLVISSLMLSGCVALTASFTIISSIKSRRT